MQPFTLYVMQSAHTDIGYTHPQEQIRRMYVDAYDRVLELCRQTADAPAERRFKWTCETFWQVQHYLTQRPERRGELLDYVRNGQIEITAAYLHFADVIDADAYRRSVRLAVDFCEQHDVPLRCALHSDINGWPWAAADIFAEFDIPYFCSQVHIDSATDPLGWRGSVHYHWLLQYPPVRPDAPTRIPQAFWWVGPQGGRVLHWLNEHYLLGNMLGLSGYQDFHADKSRYYYRTDRMSADELYARAAVEIPRYLERLQADGYPYPALLLSTAGFNVDNSPPDSRWLDVIARWNAEHDAVRIQTVTLGEWFDVLAQTGTSALPEYQVAWPDHWAHGLGTATARVAQARRTQRRRHAVEALVQQGGSSEAANMLADGLEQERLSLEHTFDAWSTTARPDASLNHLQQIVKELTFHRAELCFDEAVALSLRELSDAEDPRLALYVPADDTGAAQRVIHFDSVDQQLDPAAHTLVGEDGQTYRFQLDDTLQRQFVTVLPTAADRMQKFHVATRISQPAADESTMATLSNDAWTLEVDPQTGGLHSLRERSSGREWASADHAYRFGQLVHEAVTHPAGRDAVGNVARLIALGSAKQEVVDTFVHADIVTHSTPIIAAEMQRQSGDVFDAITLKGSGDRIGAVTIDWRVYHKLPLVELSLEWHKLWSDLPEAAYVAFPFAVDDGALSLETSGGFFRPGFHGAGGQLTGTCSSYYTVQRAAHIRDGEASLLWLPLDAPLVMPNAIDYNRWETDEWRWNGFLASMPVNHYWHTNYPTSQRGALRLRYWFVLPDPDLPIESAVSAVMPYQAYGWW
ncbi:MAG: hypothetical protein IT320_12240 [Anaerolineae bacterium]|nr:hypothetical protein [Anaerolineae bacterium]